MQVFVINLPSATKRRTFQERQLQKLGLEYQIIPAMSIDDISEATYKKHYFDWQRPMRKAEVACYFSHQNLWHKVIRNGKPALILEDDALLSKHLPFLLTQVKNKNGIDLLNLEARKRKKMISKKFEEIGNHKLYKLLQDRTGSAGYILYPGGAKKLIQHEHENGIALADAHITSCNKLIAHQIEPAMVVQLDCCEFYGIYNADTQTLPNSSIWNQCHEKSDIRFKVKRIIAQIRLGLRQLGLITKSQRRHIIVQRNDMQW